MGEWASGVLFIVYLQYGGLVEESEFMDATCATFLAFFLGFFGGFSTGPPPFASERPESGHAGGYGGFFLVFSLFLLSGTSQYVFSGSLNGSSAAFFDGLFDGFSFGDIGYESGDAPEDMGGGFGNDGHGVLAKNVADESASPVYGDAFVEGEFAAGSA